MVSGGSRRLSSWNGYAGRLDHPIISGIIQLLNIECEGNAQRHR